MGWCPYYQAIPVRSGLYRLLAEDRNAEIVLCALSHQGRYPLDIYEDGRDIGDKWEEWFVESFRRMGRFDPRGTFDRTLALLLEGIESTCRANPGLKHRSLMLENCWGMIEERLKECGRSKIISCAIPEGESLLGGDSKFSCWEAERDDPSFEIITPRRVKYVLETFVGVQPSRLFDEASEDGLLNPFRDLLKLYREVAERGEAILFY